MMKMRRRASMQRMRWGRVGKPAIPTLIEALRQESKSAWNRNLDRGDFTNPSQLDTIYGLAAVGEPAVLALTEVGFAAAGKCYDCISEDGATPSGCHSCNGRSIAR